uniref:Reverse transcriptase domain-containing protein n=1 Tax=Panagrolaimus sp. JU765 TaxID=591449 RepID=A0AC34PWH8_9BILA
MDKKDRRSSILRTIDENQPGNTNRIPRRVSFHNFRIVKEFDSALEAIDRTPQQEPMQLSTDASSLGLSAETAENVALPENVFAMNETFTESKDTTTNSKTNETAFILNKLDGDFVAFENDETLV